MAKSKGDASGEQGRERKTVLTFLIAYGGFVAGTILIPISPTLGGIIFWISVFGVFGAGWMSGKK